MNEEQLAKTMDRFHAGDIDVMVSTSIIESGLDIPNANTLIIDRADLFGLSQLYQLRGRVGRGAQQAYAYLFLHPRFHTTEEARQRLEVLAENTRLGSGYAIADARPGNARRRRHPRSPATWPYLCHWLSSLYQAFNASGSALERRIQSCGFTCRRPDLHPGAPRQSGPAASKRNPRVIYLRSSAPPEAVSPPRRSTLSRGARRMSLKR